LGSIDIRFIFATAFMDAPRVIALKGEFLHFCAIIGFYTNKGYFKITAVENFSCWQNGGNRRVLCVFSMSFKGSKMKKPKVLLKWNIKEIWVKTTPFMKKSASLWRSYKYQAILIFIIITAALSFITYLGKISGQSFWDEFAQKDKPFYIRNIAFVLTAMATAVFTWWKNNINQKNSEIQENNRQDALFAQGVDFLKETNDLITRKSGAHLLKDLAVTSPAHTQKCIDVICSLNENWMPKFLKNYPDFFEINYNFPNIKNTDELKLRLIDEEKEEFEYLPQSDEAKIYAEKIALSQLALQAVSEIIRKVSENYEFKGPYDLSYKYLCGGSFSRLNFGKFGNMVGTNLQSSVLIMSNLESANLREAHLESANLRVAHLESADLYRAHLESADLSGAHLESAYLGEAHLESAYLGDSHLESADLDEAHLESADLDEAHLESAYLSGAHLESTKFINCYLENAIIKTVDFSKSDITGTDFRKAKGTETAKFGENRNNAIFNDEDYKRHYPY
jgi:uncharacterized protein YjbI with pentapeptide repeats